MTSPYIDSIAENRPDRSFAFLAHVPDLVDHVIQIMLRVRDDPGLVIPSVSVDGERALANPLRAKGFDVFRILAKVYFVK